MSARAAWRLESLGFTHVYRYTAGKMDWRASGLPIEGQFADEPCAKDIARRDVPTFLLLRRELGGESQLPEQMVGEQRPLDQGVFERRPAVVVVVDGGAATGAGVQVIGPCAWS